MAGLRVRVAARPEDLLGELLTWLDGPRDDPFAVDTVVVPNAGLREWVITRTVTELGVLAGVEFIFPAELTRRVAGLADPDSDPWRPERLAWHVLALIASGADLGATPWQGSPERPWTVARRVADLLERYGTQRPDLVRTWLDGQDRDGGGPDAVELDAARRWQAATWRATRARIAQPSPAERLIALAARPDGDPGPDRTESGLPARLAVLGLSSITAPTAAVLARAARRSDVLLLATSAAPGVIAGLRVGADAQVGGGRTTLLPARRRSEPEPGHHPLLAAWGRPTRESAELLALLAAGSGAELVTGPAAGEPAGDGGTQLARLQADIAGDRGVELGTADRHTGGDGSVQVHTCHGLARQLEVLRDALLHALADDPTLRPRDIAVLCVDLEAAAPLAVPILGAEVDGQHLPVLVTDRSAANTPAVHLALAAAFALTTSRLERDEVLSFLSLPAVIAALGLDVGDLELLERNADALDVRWGRDGAHRTRWGYGTDVVVGTWREALDRLLAGLLLHDDVGVVDGLAPAAGLGAQDLGRIGRLADALEASGELARLADRPLSPLDWGERLRWLVDTFLRPRPRAGDAARPFAAQASEVRAAVDGLVSDAVAADVTLPLDVREIRTALMDRLDGGVARARLRTGQVSVASLTPLRGVPFRVVAVVGVDDSLLARTGADDDDILALAPRLGERDPALEQRAALLDAVLAARDLLIVTCDGHDVRTGEELPLPTAVEELLECLRPAEGGADGEGTAAGAPIVVEHPRHLVDPRNLTCGPQAIPRVRADQPWTFSRGALRALEARRSLGVDQEPSLARLAAGQLREPTGDGGWRFVTLPSREGAGDGAVDASSSGTLDLDLDRLVAALQRPARTFLRERLGVVLPDELESSPRPVELWPQGSLESWRLGDDLLRTLLDGGTVQDWMTARPARGGLPPGRLGSEHMARLAEEVVDLVRAAGLEPVAGTPLTPAASPIHLEVPVRGIAGELSGVRRVRLTGTVRHHDGRIVDLAYTRDHRRHVVGAWVGLLAATAAGTPVASAHVVRRPASDRPAAPVVRDLAVTGADDAARAEQARVTLADLVDLALRIRSAPVALLPRAGWALARGERDAAALKRDLDDTATALVLGSPTLADLAAQRSTVVDEGLPEGDHPAQRWGLAMVGALARSTGSEA